MSQKLDRSDVSTLLTAQVDVSVPGGRFTLTVVEGADSGATLTIDETSPSRVLVGTGPVCDFRLKDVAVSRRHLALEIVDRRLRVTDLESTNGTLVNGVRIIGAYAGSGDVLGLGATRLSVGEERATASQPSASRAANPMKQSAPSAPVASFGRTLGESAEMRKLYPLLERLAQAHVPVILEGETGTGKEVLAESMHERSPRAAGPFVVFDCTAVPPNLIESELFGHERGAFTGAVASRAGVFEQAQGGTLLIDEIGDLDLALQPKLLRALERSEVRRVGGDRPIRVDVRVLSATRRDLDREVTLGRFRDDLFHRLAVTRVELPPLRNRHGDVRILAKYFCEQLGASLSALAPELLQRWEEYSWPGNVRELRNAVARHLALGALAPDYAREGAAPQGSSAAQEKGASSSGGTDFLESVVSMRLPIDAARQRILLEFESRYVEQVLADHGGNVARAAAASGVARRHFQRLRARARLPRA